MARSTCVAAPFVLKKTHPSLFTSLLVVLYERRDEKSLAGIARHGCPETEKGRDGHKQEVVFDGTGSDNVSAFFVSVWWQHTRGRARVTHAVIVIFLEFFAWGLLTTPMLTVRDTPTCRSVSSAWLRR